MALIVALLLTASVAAAQPEATRGAGAEKDRGKKVKQSRGLYWGAWIGDQLTGEAPPWDMTAMNQFEAAVGKGASLLQFASPFADCNQSPCDYYEFPTEQMQRIRAHGAIPIFSWNSASSRGGSNDPGYQLSDLLAGAHDEYIARVAAAARDWGHPFFLRFDWEMNGDWFPWSESVNGRTKGQFVAAWRRVHDIFTAVGATNATWVWCPYADASRRLQQLGQLYPGDAYVDWTCLDGFNWGRNAVNPLPWRSFDQIFSQSYREVVRHIAPGKPMMLAEFATNGSGRTKARWLNQAFRHIAKKYKRIRAIVYFNQVDRGVQWPVDSSQASLRAFSRNLKQHPYRQNRFSELVGSPIKPPR